VGQVGTEVLAADAPHPVRARRPERGDVRRLDAGAVRDRGRPERGPQVLRLREPFDDLLKLVALRVPLPTML
jgi:hypothetical protein